MNNQNFESVPNAVERGTFQSPVWKWQTISEKNKLPGDNNQLIKSHGVVAE